ncbi:MULTISPECIES: zinc ABC transporter substrate-binding protein AztC [unclassified Pseudonocardia]|uniref:zinc ABC transporter substrate-binding protein AztC n=1 Tax=unclassified Pseudonocardia TaxID=2619320 RepID=UPI0001FFE41F|nr:MULTISPECIES: zinc ABC transporter substrate-binding protein AztC [unclassified Pseudonocardia]ALE73529.1 ABC transporter substrate-binding protein [Pseudonocardia sp. EC080625-04]ALL76940.1 ABC transporter substrate-binding protein [Pseudonocardia sp. EC080610-09]ALL83971.1 ABC transporter substrate-binding protein [Pseudonocardia sp. EC080619-01]OLM18593.1 Zinc ABC transporter, periplasmic-binding protein ZnuA [Pseudonocardia sp. Ae707_Ps1]
MSRARLPILLALVVALVATGCGGAAPQRDGIVVTTNILGDITRNVVGDQAEITVLMKPDADPHSFGISAQDAARMEQAGLIIHNGLGLEEGVSRNVHAAADAGTPELAVGERVDPIPYVSGDSDGQLDPHFWTDPLRVRDATRQIAAEVITHVDGIDAAAVEANTERYAERLTTLDRDMTAAFAPLPPERRKLVTNHHVFGYLAGRYEFDIVGAVLPSGTTLASPSASDLSGLADTIRAAGVPTIFADSSQPDRLARVLAEQAGVDVEVVPLFSESLSRPGSGAETYLDLMRSNTTAIRDGLRG